MRRSGVAAALAFAAMPSAASAATVTAGALTATVHASPWHVDYNAVDEAPGSLAFTAGGVTARATRAVGGHMVGRAYVATLRTTDPQGRTIAVRIAPAGNGIITVDATGPPDADAMAVRLERQGGERFLGFGERSDQVVRSSGEVQNRVTEGPYQPSENAIVRAFVPPQGFNDRADATYFPDPVGALHARLRGPGGRERHEPLRAWQPVERGRRRRPPAVQRLRRPAARRRAAPLQRRRRAPAAARRAVLLRPLVAARRRRAQNIAQLKAAGALGSLDADLHALPALRRPAGPYRRAAAMTAQAHDAGLAITTYFNPMICTTYQPPYGLAAAGGFLNTNAAGQPYVYPYTGSSGFRQPVRLHRAGTVGFYGDLLSEAVGNGYDGWMEDFGEYTPPDAQSANGTPGPEMGANERAALRGD